MEVQREDFDAKYETQNYEDSLVHGDLALAKE
jgi:hypothetical protein